MTKPSPQDTEKRRLGCSSMETRTLTLRLLFVGSMLVAAAVFGGLAFKITKDQEQNTAQQTYKSIALSALEEAQAIAQRKIQGAESLATIWSFAFPQASQWPFVGMKGFSQVATNVALLSSSAGHGFMPIVRPDQVEEFEAHAKQLYQDYEYPETAGESEFGFGIYGMDPSKGYSDNRFHDKYGNTTWDNKYDIMAPFLQHKNTFPSPALLLRNLHQFELRGRLMESIIDCGKAADPSTSVSPNCGAVTDFTEIFVRPGPSAVFFNPVFPSENPTEVVGFIGTSINFAETLTNIVPDFVDGLECVISNGAESYTYVIQKGVPLLLGEGDQHDPQYDSFGHSTTLSHAETGAEASATYILTVYPTEVMFEEFNTSIPMIAAIGFAAVIFFCTCIFFLYDYFMQYETHQHKKILEVKRRFVRFISHEIRTPMNVVCMGLDLLQAELQDKLKKEKHQKLMLPSRKTSGVEPAEDDTKNAQQDEMQDEETTTNYWIGLIQEILENSHNAVSVLNDLLNYDKVESGTFELDIGKVDISSVVKQTVKEFSIQARNRKVDLVLSTDEPADIEEGLKHDPDSICVIGDERRLSQCVRNLLSNALKFTAENETVNVTISFVRDGLSDIKSPTFGNEGDDSSTRSSERERAGSIIIQVTDNGVGLSSEQLNLLFNEGVQFNANVLQHGGGSGLGLCLAKEIVEMHSGRIEARSEGLGHGTTFEIELPLYTRSTKEETNLAPTEACSTNSRDEHQLVLVVDDVLTNSKMLVRLLERAGHKCLVASDGEEAIEAFEANQADLRSGATSTPIHTVLMDFEMPRMNGPDATKRLRELGCTAHIFGVTGNVLAEDVALFKASGADYVLYKPINLPAIDSAWQNVDISKRR